MSFRQDLLKARMSHLAPDARAMGLMSLDNGNDDEAEEELDAFDEDSAMPSTSSGFMKPRMPGQSSRHAGLDYSPLSGKDCFARAMAVNVAESSSSTSTSTSNPVGAATGPSSFRVYYTAPNVKLQRNGSAAGSMRIDEDDNDEEGPVVFVCHHGAGYSAMSFALLAQELVKVTKGAAGVLALDCRGHGKTACHNETNTQIDTLADDLVGVLKEVFPNKSQSPSFVLVGHSMGGSVVVHACQRIQQEVGQVVGVVNLDVVEGTAMEALSGMMEIVSSRPKGFASLEAAIEWHVRTKTVGSLASARISVPPLMREDVNETSPNSRWKWRTDLAATQPYWEGWFKDLSSKFLSQRAAKLLVLAGAESLDKDLMIGQMQGKYQLSVFQDVGHCLQEEAPGRLANLLVEFWRRNVGANDQARILKGVKKVGER